jgi:PAS domain S-box-containing protein
MSAETVVPGDLLAALSPDAIFVLDENLAIVFANQSAERLFGYPIGELLKRNVSMLVAERSRTKQRARLRAFQRRGRRTVTNPWSPFWGLHRSGKAIPLEMSIARTAEKDHYLICFVRDVSARQRAEQLARERAALLGQIADGVVIADPVGRVTFVNEAARHLLGVTATGRKVERFLSAAQFLGPDGTPILVDDLPLTQTVRTGATIVDAELTTRRPDGTQVIVQSNSTPLVAQDGTRLGSVATFRDVTAQREFELRKSEFIGTVSHELRTPITVIQGQAQLLARRLVGREPPGSIEIISRLGKIEQTAKLMTGLVNRLIEVTRSRLGQAIPLSPRLTEARSTPPLEVEAIGEVARALVQETSLERVASIIVDHGLRLFNAAAATVWLLDPRGEALRPLATRSLSTLGPLTEAELQALPIDSTTIAGKAAGLKQPVEVFDIQTAGSELTLARRIFDRESFRSGHAQPLFAKGRLVGVLSILYPAPHPFAAPERALIQALGDLGAAAIDNARVHHDLEEAADQEQVARRRAETLAAERAAIVRHIADGVILADANGNVSYVNDAARRLLRAPDAGPSIWEYAAKIRLFKPDGKPYSPTELLLYRAWKLGETVIGVEQHIRQPGYPEVIIESSAAPIIGENGQSLGGVLTLRDVTMQRALEHQRDSFYSAATHDLKNPLTVILIGAERLESLARRSDQPSLQQLVPALKTIGVTAKKMVSLVDELLDVTRLRMGRQLELNRRPTDLVSLLQQVVAEYQATTDRLQIRMVPKVRRLVGCWDEARLERLFGNLLSNAIKYSPGRGDVVVEVTASGKLRERWAIVQVRDQGLGIPAADLPNIFDYYWRAPSVGARIAGSGIGLASARYLAQQHGGSISAESEVGVGSTFTVRLPLNLTKSLAAA